MKKWLVDAHNLLHTRPELVQLYKTNRIDALEQLVLMVEESCQRKGRAAHIVFDGHHTPLSVNCQYCSWSFSGDTTADEIIIQKTAKNASWIAVTNDADLKKKVRKYGASAVSTKSVSQTADTPKAPKQHQPGEEPDPVVTKNEVLLMQLSLSQKPKE